MPKSTLRLGSRGSKLALAQAELVRAGLAAEGVACEIVTVRTTGDRIQDRPLAAAGGKGLFAKELEDALLGDRIDLAVHSMKDLPAMVPEGLEIAAVLAREDPRDVFVSSRADSLEALPPNAMVGTSSVRRRAQVLRKRTDLETTVLRGNVDTRLAKLDGGEIDAAILAYAGLKRLGLEHRATSVLPAETWLPALSQGAIGIEVRHGDAAAASVTPLNHLPTAVELACERAFQQALDGSCTTPIGGLAKFADGQLRFRGEVIAPDGSGFADTAVERLLARDPLAEAAALGREAGLALKPRAAQWLNN